MHLIDQNVGTYPTLFITLLEIVAVIYVYGKESLNTYTGGRH